MPELTDRTATALELCAGDGRGEKKHTHPHVDVTFNAYKTTEVNGMSCLIDFIDYKETRYT